MTRSAKVTLCAGTSTKTCGRNVGKVTTGNDVRSVNTGGVKIWREKTNKMQQLDVYY